MWLCFILISEDTATAAPACLLSLHLSVWLPPCYLFISSRACLPAHPSYSSSSSSSLHCLLPRFFPTFLSLPTSLLTTYLFCFSLSLLQSLTPLPIFALSLFFFFLASSFSSFFFIFSPSISPSHSNSRWVAPGFQSLTSLSSFIFLFLPHTVAASLCASLLLLGALFCLNQELKCCIFTQTMTAIQSGTVQIGVPC